MRPRDLTRFAAGPYDVLVIGGGIAGLTIAYEASSRGPPHGAGRSRRLRRRDLVQPPEDRARRASIAAERPARSRAGIDPRTARARPHRPLALAPAALSDRDLSLGHAQPAGAPSSVRARRSAGTAAQRGPRAGAAPAGAAVDLQGRDAAVLPGHCRRRADRRGAVVRLPDGGSGAAHVRVRGGRRSPRRGSRELRRSRGRTPRRIACRGHGSARHPERPVLLDHCTRDRERHRLPCPGADGAVRRSAAGADAQGDEPGDNGSRERHRAGGAIGRRPDADARPLAGLRADRHQPDAGHRHDVRRAGHECRSRRVRRRRKQRLSGSRADASAGVAGSPRRRAGSGGRKFGPPYRRLRDRASRPIRVLGARPQIHHRARHRAANRRRRGPQHQGGGQALAHRFDNPARCRHCGSRSAGHRDGSRAASRRAGSDAPPPDRAVCGTRLRHRAADEAASRTRWRRWTSAVRRPERKCST